MRAEATGREHLTPVKIRDTSATERATFRKCRRQWLLTVVHRLEGVEGNQNFWLGTLVHRGLEVYYLAVKVQREQVARGELRDDPDVEHATAVDDALDAYQSAYDESLVPIAETLGFLWPNVEPGYRELGELGFDMLAAYFDRERTDPLVDEVVDVERRVFVPIRTPAGRRVGTLSVKADLVGRRQGRLAAVDHKTASREANASQLDLDDQLTAEVFAVWQDGDEFPEEAIYNVLFKKAARPPKRLKDGKGGVVKLSQDKSQPTTLALYRAEIDRHGLDYAVYEEVLDHLQAVEASGESPFFQRESVLRTPAQMAAFEANLYEEFRDMRAVAAHPERAYPNPTPFSCPSCPVKTVCLTIQDDGDAAAIIRAGFVVGEPRR